MFQKSVEANCNKLKANPELHFIRQLVATSKTCLGLKTAQPLVIAQAILIVVAGLCVLIPEPKVYIELILGQVYVW